MAAVGAKAAPGVNIFDGAGYYAGALNTAMLASYSLLSNIIYAGQAVAHFASGVYADFMALIALLIVPYLRD